MTKKRSYKEIKSELDDILSWFDSDDLDIEEAIVQHETAQKLIVELEQYLKESELKISKAK